MINIINDNNAFDGLFSKAMEKTLYHGTTIDKAQQISKEGLWPQTGDFVSQFYGDEYMGDDENGDDMYEETPLEELIFAADKEDIDKALTAMTAQIAVKLNKDLHDVTDEEIKRNGALIVIKEAGWEQRPKEDKNYEWEMYHQQGYNHVEPGDYYSERHEPISFVLTGNKMISILRQIGVWPRTWGPDAKSNKNELFIKHVKRQHPEKSVQEIIDKINSLNPQEYREYYNSYTKTAQLNPEQEINYNDLSVRIYKFVEKQLVPRINYYYSMINKLEKYYIQMNSVSLSKETRKKNNQAYAILINKIKPLETLFSKLNSKFQALPNKEIDLKKPEKKRISKDFNYLTSRDLADNINFTLEEIKKLPSDEDLFLHGEELLDF